MMDGASGGIGKAAQELMQEMQKAQADMQNKADKTGGPKEAFQNTMRDVQGTQPTTQVNATHQAQHIQPTQNATNVLMQARADAMSPSTKVGAAAKAERSKMADMLEQLVGGQDKMSKIMNLALSGKQFNPQELLAMQAGVYRFSQELDLTGKVIEKATSGIKQTMNTQV